MNNQSALHNHVTCLGFHPYFLTFHTVHTDIHHALRLFILVKRGLQVVPTIPNAYNVCRVRFGVLVSSINWIVTDPKLNRRGAQDCFIRTWMVCSYRTIIRPSVSILTLHEALK